MSEQARGHRVWVRPAVTVIAVLMTVLSCGLIATGDHLYHQMQRIEGVFTGLHHRPDRATEVDAAGALNILLMGTDRRSPEPSTGMRATTSPWAGGEQRSDTLMLLHVDADDRGASLVSIPRDAWVDIPGHGEHKINAAYSFGGPSLAVRTVEQLTGVHVDHVAVIDWAGLERVTDAAGGVDLGGEQMDGTEALSYVRERYSLPRGDLDRIERQQEFLRALMERVQASAGSGDPRQIYSILDIATEHVSLDEQLGLGEMRRVAWAMGRMDPDAVRMLTAPVRGLGREGAQSVVYLDEQLSTELWRAVRESRVDDWLSAHPDA